MPNQGRIVSQVPEKGAPELAETQLWGWVGVVLDERLKEVFAVKSISIQGVLGLAVLVAVLVTMTTSLPALAANTELFSLSISLPSLGLMRFCQFKES